MRATVFGALSGIISMTTRPPLAMSMYSTLSGVACRPLMALKSSPAAACQTQESSRSIVVSGSVMAAVRDFGGVGGA